MPIIAIGAAIASVSAVGAGGFAAVLAGTASLGTTFAAIGAVGATLGAIGEVAGVKELKTAGMVLGGIGGVGSLASAVGAFGEGATLNSVFGSGAADVTAGDFAGVTTASDSADDLIGAGAFGGGTSASTAGSSLINGGSTTLGAGTGAMTANSSDIFGAVNKLAGVTTDQPDEAQLAGGSSDVRQQKLSDTAPKASAVAKQTNVDNIVEGPTSDDNAPPKDVGSKVTGTVSVAGATDAAAKAADKPGFWASNTGALTAMGLVQGAGSFLSGAFDEVKPAQAAAYNAQAAANNAQAALTNKELSNMNSNIPTARRVAVTGSLLNPGRAA